MIFKSLLISTLILALLGCQSTKEDNHLLIAAREAPLGWVFLYLNPEGTFELHNTGVRGNGDLYEGRYTIADSILNLSFTDSIPFAGCEQAVLKSKFVEFDGCLGSLQIWKNELDENFEPVNL